MDKKLFTVINGEKKVYDVILEFTSNTTGKNIVFFNDESNMTNMAYYEKEDDLYKLIPIDDPTEIEMCKRMIVDIKYYIQGA